jgi:hypothetical protein
VLGEAGNDTLVAGAGNDQVLRGGDNDDSLLGDAGADTLSGGNGLDRISGGDANDSLLGDAGNDTLLAGEGRNTVVGGTGHDSIIAGAETLPKYDSVDASLAFTQGPWTLSLTASNLGDKRGITGSIYGAPAPNLPHYEYFLQKPRTLGVSLRYDL